MIFLCLRGRWASGIFLSWKQGLQPQTYDVDSHYDWRLMNEQPNLTANIRVGHEENEVGGIGMAPVSMCAKNPTKQVSVSYWGLSWKRGAPLNLAVK